MTTLLLRALEHVHGHLGWLAVAALLHPAIVLRRPRRRAPLAVSLATGFVVVAALLGASIYPSYRERVKQQLFLDAPRVGWLFERKEHLAVGAVAFALVGCVAHLTLPLWDDAETRATSSRVAHRSFLLAFGLSLVTAVLGVIVASARTF